MVSEIFTNYIHIHPHPNLLTRIKNIKKIGNLVSPENGNSESATTQLRKKRVKKSILGLGDQSTGKRQQPRVYHTLIMKQVLTVPSITGNRWWPEGVLYV